MANFTFNEGATAAASAGVDWVGTDWDCCLYEDMVVPDQTMTWTEVQASIIATVPYANKAITANGACSADAIEFIDVATTQPDGRIPGFIIKRNSDNLLLVHFDQGFDNLGPRPVTGNIIDILNVRADNVSFTFTLNPGLNNEAAWFRL